MPFQLKTKLLDFCCLIVPDLIRPCIIGVDWLNNYSAQINTETKELRLRRSQDEDDFDVTFHLRDGLEFGPKIQSEARTLKFNRQTSTILEQRRLLKKKLQEASVNSAQRNELEKLLLKFLHLFSERLGRTSLYERRIVLKDPTPFVKKTTRYHLRYVPTWSGN